MTPIIQHLVDAIYSEPRVGRFMPARIELGPDLFPHFQREHRKALAAVLPEAGNVYPGSLAGVPVVEVKIPGAVLVRQDGRRELLAIDYSSGPPQSSQTSPVGPLSLTTSYPPTQSSHNDFSG